MQDNKLDLSGLERITPRADSWNKVCARLDVEKHLEKPKAMGAGNILQFRMSAALPLAASFIFICLYLVMTASGQSSSNVSMNSVVSTELSSWYDNLGEADSDDYEILDNTTTISYLMKE